MSLDEIKRAISNGKRVFWKQENYEVKCHRTTSDWQYLIHFSANEDCIGLTWQDGSTLNGEPEDFYMN